MRRGGDWKRGTVERPVGCQSSTLPGRRSALALLTPLPIGRGFLYLVAIIDWASRAVLAWRLSNTMDVSFCVAALEEALATYGTPEIFNTDQGSQFTSVAFTGALVGAGIKISMDGRGRWMDNVFIERLWRSLKHEDIYLKGYADGREAKAGIASWIAFYNDRRLHQSLGYRTPMAVWRERMQAAKAVDMVDNADALTTCPSATAADRVSGCVIERDQERSVSN
ncbi:transposase InsO family protein [Bradyrhizobium japonicum]|nr:DDE-type integrase/transposase/recombinase [Bradyrhizobium elkanii USDA 76]